MHHHHLLRTFFGRARGICLRTFIGTAGLTHQNEFTLPAHQIGFALPARKNGFALPALLAVQDLVPEVLSHLEVLARDVSHATATILQETGTIPMLQQHMSLACKEWPTECTGQTA
eukprot:1140973-Pelagomonas_calceolata.AAC.3